MSPYEQVERLYETHPRQYTFEEDLRRFSKMGYVFSTPDSFIMGYHLSDCWFIYAFAGNLGDAFKFMPHPATWVEFVRRDGENKLYLYEKIKARIDARKHRLKQ